VNVLADALFVAVHVGRQPAALMGHAVVVHLKNYGIWVDEASLEVAVEQYNEGLDWLPLIMEIWPTAYHKRNKADKENDTGPD